MMIDGGNKTCVFKQFVCMWIIRRYFPLVHMSEILSTFVYHAVPTRFLSLVSLYMQFMFVFQKVLLYIVLFYLEKMFNLTSHGTGFEMLSASLKA